MAAINYSFKDTDKIIKIPCITDGYRYPGKVTADRFRLSIINYGLLEPLVIDKEGRIINGKNRLFALVSLEQKEAPAIYTYCSYSFSSYDLLEAVRKNSDDFFRQADILAVLAGQHLLSREYIGKELNVSVSYVSNKIRLSNYDECERNLITGGNLTERHARALLKIDKSKRCEAINYVIENHLNVRDTELLADSISQNKESSLGTRYRSMLKLCDEFAEKADALDYNTEISDKDKDYTITVYFKPGNHT